MTMLLLKAWRDTRWRFWIGALVMVGIGAFTVWGYPRLVALLASLPSADPSASRIDGLRASADVVRTYRGYVFAQLRQAPVILGIPLASLLGCGGLPSAAGDGEALFTLSLPVSRTTLLIARAAVGLVEWSVIAVAPAFAVALLSPAIGQSFSPRDAGVCAAGLLASGAAVYFLALCLSTMYTDAWRPALLSVAVVLVLSVVERLFPQIGEFGLVRLMKSESFVRTGAVPWTSFGAVLLVCIALHVGAAVRLDRAEF